MKKQKRKKHTCKACKKSFTHPNIYSDRCEDCFAKNCLHDDSVNNRPRKARGGSRIEVHFIGHDSKPGESTGATSW